MKTPKHATSARIMNGSVMHGDIVAQEEVRGLDGDGERLVQLLKLGVGGRGVRRRGSGTLPRATAW